MPIRWSTLPASHLCIVTGRGTVTRPDIEAYMAGTIREGAKGFAKLVDMTACTLALNNDDLDGVAQSLMEYGWGERPGPVAIVVSTALNLDMAVLVKKRVGDRPFRIFTNLGTARDWLERYLASYRKPDPDDTFPTGSGLRPRVPRTH